MVTVGSASVYTCTYVLISAFICTWFPTGANSMAMPDSVEIIKDSEFMYIPVLRYCWYSETSQ